MTATTGSRLQEAINEYWSDRAPSYDDYQQRAERRDVDREAWAGIWRRALPAAPAAVLDVGTGSGHVACLLARLGYDVTGIDLADGMLDRAREHAARLPNPPRIERGDAVAPDFPPESFDAVTGRYVLWTLRDPAGAADTWRRLLRPGGVVAMADSLWFPDGMNGLYGEGAEAGLPLAQGQRIQRYADALHEGGLADVQVHELREILDLDRRYGVAPGHDVQLQYLITGRR